MNRNRFIVVTLFALLGAGGTGPWLTTPIDAIPDLSDNQVIVFTDWPGRSPQEVEDATRVGHVFGFSGG